MIFKWFEQKPTAGMIEEITGKKVKRLLVGGIETGEYDEDGIPYTARGIQVEFDDGPTEQDLEKVDSRFWGLRREGGKTIGDEVKELKDNLSLHEVDIDPEIDELKSKVAKLEKK